MFSSLSGPVRVHVHWVREALSRAVEVPVSATVTSLESLPEAAAAAVLATGRSEVELHLPILWKQDRENYEAWCADLVFRENFAGVIVGTRKSEPEPDGATALHLMCVLALRMASEDATPLTIVAEPPQPGVFPSPKGLARACAPQGGLTGAPPERTREYARLTKKISSAIQQALRTWVPAQHVRNLEDLQDTSHIYALAAWSAAEPVKGSYVDELAVEVLNTAMLTRAYTGIAKHFRARMAEVFSGISAAMPADATPEQTRLTKAYNPALAPRIWTSLQLQPRYLNYLFNHEHRLITAFLGLCGRLASWAEPYPARPAQQAYTIVRNVREEMDGIQILLRGYYQRRSQQAVFPCLLAETVRVLESARSVD